MLPTHTRLVKELHGENECNEFYVKNSYEIKYIKTCTSGMISAKGFPGKYYDCLFKF